MPNTAEDWMKIADGFKTRWQLPHCCGAIDGKHIRIVKPDNSGSMFYNYKGFFSIVLMALVDAECNFVYIDVGAQGRVSDGGVFSNSSLCQLLDSGRLNLPPSEPIDPSYDVNVPYFFVGDDAFPMQPNLMKPYSRRNLTADELVTNYRISRARRTSENAFGMLANVFRVFHTPIYLKPAKAAKIVRTACVLHNFIRQRVNYVSASGQSQQDEQVGVSCNLTELKSIRGNYTNSAKVVRDQLKEYFCTVGAIPWQDKQAVAF